MHFRLSKKQAVLPRLGSKRSQREIAKNEVNEMNLIDNYRNWRRYRRTCNELNSLSERELTDLGISRHDIPRVARGAR